MQFTITTTPNIIGDKVGIEAPGLSYTNLGRLSSLECNEVCNNNEIRRKCNKIAQLIKEIEALNE